MIPHPLAGTPFGTALDVCIVLAALCWLLAVLTREYSWVDRLWSLAPPAYCLIVAADLGFESARVTLMTVLVLLWGIRLTYNFARKGGYRRGGEDYRWGHLRDNVSNLQLQLLNATFIAPGQLGIVWLFSAPIHQAWVHADKPLGWLDYLAAVLFLVFLAFESIADAQMWRFQQNKKRLVAEGIEVEQPFMREGLFRFCRHPNYLCEMALWVTFYLFAVSASWRIWHWTGLGCIALILLFVGSARMTEQISSGKYTGYSSYQAAVPKFIPRPVPSRLRR